MLCPPQSRDPLVQDWIERHRNPVSFALHMLGIPPTILGAVLMPIYLLLVSIPIFLLALSLFVGGYVLQFVGHAIDRSEPGEVTFLRRWATRKLASLQEKPTLATRSQP